LSSSGDFETGSSQGLAAMRDFGPAYVGSGPEPRMTRSVKRGLNHDG